MLFSFLGGKVCLFNLGCFVDFVVLGFLPILLRIFGIKYFCVYY